MGVLPRFDKGWVYNPHTVMFPLHNDHRNTMCPPLITNTSLYGVHPLYMHQRQIQVLASCSLSLKMHLPYLLNRIVNELTLFPLGVSSSLVQVNYKFSLSSREYHRYKCALSLGYSTNITYFSSTHKKLPKNFSNLKQGKNIDHGNKHELKHLDLLGVFICSSHVWLYQ